MKQPRHSLATLVWRGAVAAGSHLAMVTGVYPLLPHAVMLAARRKGTGGEPQRSKREELSVLGREWLAGVAISVARPLGFLALPGSKVHGPRPVIVLHGYAMNRANFWMLGKRMADAGLGPVIGFEYWSLGSVARAARELAEFVDKVRAHSGAAQVDIVAHSMGGLVARYYLTFGGGDGIVKNLITIGSPHRGTETSRFGLGEPGRELVVGSPLLQRLEAAPQPSKTEITVVWSSVDALVPTVRHSQLPHVEHIGFHHLGHVSMLLSRRVADEVIARLSA